MTKSFKDLAKQESEEMVEMFLTNLPNDQKMLIRKTIDQLISEVEQKIVEPILSSIDKETSKEWWRKFMVSNYI